MRALVRPSGLIIPTPRCERTTIRTERHAPHPMRMPGEGALVRPGDRIPETDGVVIRCERTTIGTERHAIDIISMPGEGALVRACDPSQDGWYHPHSPMRGCDHRD